MALYFGTIVIVYSLVVILTIVVGLLLHIETSKLDITIPGTASISSSCCPNYCLAEHNHLCRGRPLLLSSLDLLAPLRHNRVPLWILCCVVD